MARNVEVKARLESLQRVEARVRDLATDGPEHLAQRDVFFRVPRGRLKLRTFADGSAELIQYVRPDTAEASVSTYERVPVAHPEALERALGAALGTGPVVDKRRTVYLVGRTRVHLDQVDSLGAFLELEVVLEDGEPEADGHAEAQALLSELGIPRSAHVAVAYADLLEAEALKPR